MKIEHPTKKTIDTGGIRSDVVRKDKPVNKTIGHVTFLDIEDSSLDEVSKWLRNSSINSAFVFESSKKNFHVISTEIKACGVVNMIKDSIPIDDDKHRSIGYDKRVWTLRVVTKGDKPEPELVKVYLSAETYTEVHSKPHLDYLINDHKSKDAKKIKAHAECIGDLTSKVLYGTFEKHPGE